MSNHKSVKTQPLTTRVESELIDAIEQCVKEAGCNRNDWMKRAIRAAIQQQKMKRPDSIGADLAFFQN